jgi:hypothetical protein
MARKKLVLEAISLSSLLVLSACGSLAANQGKEISREEAIQHLDDMAVATNAADYVAPSEYHHTQTWKDKKGDISSASVDFRYVSSDKFYLSFVNEGVHVDTSYYLSSSTAFRSVMVFQYQDDTVSVSLDSAYGKRTDTVYALMKTTDADVVSFRSEFLHDVNQRFSFNKQQIAKMEKYLKAFASGTGSSAIRIGATIGADTYMKEESYRSKGAGSLVMAITPHYVGSTGEYDEPMEYDFEGNGLVSVTNTLQGIESHYTWNTSSLRDFSTAGLSDVSSVSSWRQILLSQPISAINGPLYVD